MVKILSRAISYNWKYYAVAVAVFVVFWQIFSVFSASRVADDKLLTAMRQNAAYFEKAFLEGDVFETQRIMWRIKNDNIKRITFHPVEFEGTKWIFKEAIVGNLYDRPRAQLSRNVPFISNGAELGRLEYIIDLVDVNAAVFGQNYVLFITMVFFFMGLLVLSNIGAIKTIFSIERCVDETNTLADAGESPKIQAAIQRSIQSLPEGLRGTPFAVLIGRLADVLQKASRLESELAVSKAVSDMAAQVAHDIRSPLAALETALTDMDALPGEKRELARGAVGRIGEIARDLLDKYKKPGVQGGSDGKAASPQDLKKLLEPLLAEKRAQYVLRAGLVLAFDCPTEDARANVHPAEFRRLVSNLVNNAAEACEKGGRVGLALSKADGWILLKVSDSGKGIPPEILAKLGQKGGTHGKAGGTGLGLYHARTTAESWGGSLKIESKPGVGTSVTIELPALEAGPAPKTAVLIDDDALVRMNWKTAARGKGVELKAFAAPAEFFAAGIADKDISIYIDSDLGGGIKGEDIAGDLREKGYSTITLETGHPPEKFARLPWLKVTGKEPPWA